MDPSIRTPNPPTRLVLHIERPAPARERRRRRQRRSPVIVAPLRATLFA